MQHAAMLSKMSEQAAKRKTIYWESPADLCNVLGAMRSYAVTRGLVALAGCWLAQPKQSNNPIYPICVVVHVSALHVTISYHFAYQRIKVQPEPVIL